jgi:hypothetical protein
MNNPPAFPSFDYITQEGRENPKGMTLRDYFAAQALQGMLAESGGGALHNTNLSEFAYLIADAMLNARENT